MTNSKAESTMHASPCGCNMETVGKRFAVFWLAVNVIFSLWSGTAFWLRELIHFMNEKIITFKVFVLWRYLFYLCLFLFILKISILISFCACLKATPLSVSLSVLSSLTISVDLSLFVLVKPVKNLLMENTKEVSHQNKVNMIFFFIFHKVAIQKSIEFSEREHCYCNSLTPFLISTALSSTGKEKMSII